MKTIKTYFPALLVLLFMGIGILSAQPERNQDEYLNTIFRTEEEQTVNDIPFNTADIASEALFQKLVKNDFSRDEEQSINDLPFGILEKAGQSSARKVNDSVFEEKDEAFVDDIPPVILQAMKTYQQKLLANATSK